MWESTQGLPSRSARTAVGTARSILIKEPSVMSVVAHRPTLQLGPRPASLGAKTPSWRQTNGKLGHSWTMPDAASLSRIRLRCIDPVGVVFRRSTNLLDILEEAQVSRIEFGSEIVANELHGDWARTDRGWLPLTFNGKQRLIQLEGSPLQEHEMGHLLEQAATRVRDLEQETVMLRRNLVEARAEAIDVAALQVDLGRKGRTAPVPEAESDTMLNRKDITNEWRPAYTTAEPMGPQKQVRDQVAWHAVVQRRSYSSWPRVRVPVRACFVEQFGLEWVLALRERLVNCLEIHGDIGLLELVAVCTAEEELERFRQRPLVPCKPHHEVGAAADQNAEIPCLGSLQDTQWYGELMGITEAFWVVELALSPCMDALKFAQNLSRELSWPSRAPRPALGSAPLPGGRQPSTVRQRPKTGSRLHLNEIIPRQASRVYVWPPTVVPGESKRERHVLRENPLAGLPLRRPEGAKTSSRHIADVRSDRAVEGRVNALGQPHRW